MAEHLFAPIPSTAELLTKIKRPREERSTAAKVERWCFYAALVIAVLMAAAAGLGVTGILTADTTRAVLMILMIVLAADFLIWCVTQIVDMVLTLKAGYLGAATRVDEDIMLEQKIIASLTRCEPIRLREHGKQLDLKAKLLTRRSQMGTVLSAVGVVAINLKEAGEKASIWGKLQDVPPFVFAGSLGVLIGAAAIIMLAGQLERLSGLLMLAADRIESDKKQVDRAAPGDSCRS
ncbi:hypothetical protein CPBF426_23670 [Xanthomonas arboricola pv. juglandis]|uniref:hypothetical protein n=1 Tax=Xanthomonas TaxID=338 RepID=UPI000E5B0E67|nr:MULTISPECIES: hypothetical protein [Xanthomonas]MEB2124623.1 hypothetical protein [Xanthomonas campestris pv. campestris]SYZ54237.1 hypothetical protein CPBF426_23670 [Xanthomonas arboricola pv. juglandis]MBB3760806.1 hypothetical protein [Xanthomonas arboricola]MBB4768949.1 hypothetical protein [Xanthomonas arboricola]MXV46341.1 hypothetical protein [Xanthomonas sp. LMG 8993]